MRQGNVPALGAYIGEKYGALTVVEESRSAPAHIDPEYVVELRARAAQTVLHVRNGPPSAT